MRLAGQAKGGFYAAAPAAVSAVRDLLSVQASPCLVLDPCAGEGDAVKQLAHELGAKPYAIELDEARAAAVKAAIPNALGPADFLGCRVSPNTFSLIWLNPPFDHKAGGGRVEYNFLAHAVPLLVPGGVMALVCPESVGSNHKLMDFWDQHFEDPCAIPFPEHCRPYNEVVVLGKRRKEPNCRIDGWGMWGRIFGHPVEYDLPPGRPPKQFVKWDLTDPELMNCLQESPLRGLLETREDVDLRPRPPMSPGKGHRAMLLASGHCNGLVEPEGEPPHVIRGCAHKEKFLAGQTEDQDTKGNITTKTTFSEKMVLTVRAVDHEGVIHTLR